MDFRQKAVLKIAASLNDSKRNGRDRDRTDDLYRVKVVPGRLSGQFRGCIETSSPMIVEVEFAHLSHKMSNEPPAQRGGRGEMVCQHV